MPDILGKKVLITAGPTYEAIDPVRFIGNHSTGKMGIAIAERAALLGADVTLICGPSKQASSESIHRVNVVTAEEMFDATMSCYAEQDVLILSAAVSDYRPLNHAEKKIKKDSNGLTLQLVPTKDILAHLGKVRTEHQFLVGFALETDNELDNARKKMERKRCDMIVLNSLNHSGAGFGHDTNRITILTRHNNITTFELKSKTEVANDILQTIIALK